MLPFSQSLEEANSSKQCVSAGLNLRIAWFKNSLQKDNLLYRCLSLNLCGHSTYGYERNPIYLQLQVLLMSMPPSLGVGQHLWQMALFVLYYSVRELFEVWAVKMNTLQHLDTKENWFTKL